MNKCVRTATHTLKFHTLLISFSSLGDKSHRESVIFIQPTKLNDIMNHNL